MNKLPGDIVTLTFTVINRGDVSYRPRLDCHVREHGMPVGTSWYNSGYTLFPNPIPAGTSKTMQFKATCPTGLAIEAQDVDFALYPTSGPEPAALDAGTFSNAFSISGGNGGEVDVNVLSVEIYARALCPAEPPYIVGEKVYANFIIKNNTSAKQIVRVYYWQSEHGQGKDNAWGSSASTLVSVSAHSTSKAYSHFICGNVSTSSQDIFYELRTEGGAVGDSGMFANAFPIKLPAPPLQIPIAVTNCWMQQKTYKPGDRLRMNMYIQNSSSYDYPPYLERIVSDHGGAKWHSHYSKMSRVCAGTTHGTDECFWCPERSISEQDIGWNLYSWDGEILLDSGVVENAFRIV